MMMKKIMMTMMMMTRIRKRTIGARGHDVMRVTVLRLSGVVFPYIQKKNQINANSHLYLKKTGLANRNIVLKFILNSRYIPLPV